MIARILSVYWVIGSQFWACKSRRQSSLDCWHPETYALSTPSMNHFCLWCSEVNCWQEEIHKFKTEYLLIWQKYLSTWTSIKYFGHQVQVSTKYFWISKGQVQVSTKYSIIRIKYQVQVLYLTPTLHRTHIHAHIHFREQWGIFSVGARIREIEKIWRMTLKNNRAPFLCYIKLCASFHHHMWIQLELQSWNGWIGFWPQWPWPFAWRSLF